MESFDVHFQSLHVSACSATEGTDGMCGILMVIFVLQCFERGRARVAAKLIVIVDRVRKPVLKERHFVSESRVTSFADPGYRTVSGQVVSLQLFLVVEDPFTIGTKVDRRAARPSSGIGPIGM
jgi:hypothetical protein